MINESAPVDWQDLQRQVAQILTECNLQVEIEKTVETVRGTVEIDVFGVDEEQTPPVAYLCECKHWSSAIPKTIVHAFRTVVTDYGANWGLIISSKCYQRGAHEAAENSNIRLLTWENFQSLFHKKWYRAYMIPRLYEEAEPLVDYTEPINTRVFRKADALSHEEQVRFRDLRKKYVALAFFVCRFYLPLSPYETGPPQLPLCENLPQRPSINGEEPIPSDILEAKVYRVLLDNLVEHIRTGVAEFDGLFGERA